MIEYGVSFLGLITVIFIVAAVEAHPQWAQVAKGLLPTLPTYQKST